MTVFLFFVAVCVAICPDPNCPNPCAPYAVVCVNGAKVCPDNMQPNCPRPATPPPIKNCDTLTTCDSCRNNVGKECAWCSYASSYGKCLDKANAAANCIPLERFTSPSIINSATGTCPTFVSCESLTTCEACDVAGCGWCNRKSGGSCVTIGTADSICRRQDDFVSFTFMGGNPFGYVKCGASVAEPGGCSKLSCSDCLKVSNCVYGKLSFPGLPGAATLASCNDLILTAMNPLFTPVTDCTSSTFQMLPTGTVDATSCTAKTCAACVSNTACKFGSSSQMPGAQGCVTASLVGLVPGFSEIKCDAGSVGTSIGDTPPADTTLPRTMPTQNAELASLCESLSGNCVSCLSEGKGMSCDNCRMTLSGKTQLRCVQKGYCSADGVASLFSGASNPSLIDCTGKPVTTAMKTEANSAQQSVGVLQPLQLAFLAAVFWVKI